MLEKDKIADEIADIKDKNVALYNNVLNRVLKVGEASAGVLLEILDNKTIPNEVKLSIAGGLLKQVMDFLTANNSNRNDGTK
jgi:hypothetical protein